MFLHVSVSHSVHSGTPAMHAPLPCTPPAMHAPLPCMPPCHACPPVMHTPLPCMPPAMRAPCYARPLPCTPPTTLRHAVNERAVCILLECILVKLIFLQCDFGIRCPPRWSLCLMGTRRTLFLKGTFSNRKLHLCN